MKRSTQRWVHVVLSAAVSLATFAAFAAPSLAANNLILPRSGQVGFGFSGGYGTLLPAGELGNEFGGGPSLAVRMRYRMRFERAIGLSFEAERMNSRDVSNQPGAFDTLTDFPTVSRDRMKMVTAGFDFYQMFDTRERTVKYLSIGAGLAQISAHLTDGETQFPIAGDGVFVALGGGFERFFFKSWAWDFGTRYKAVFHDGKVNHDIQLSLGMMFYAAY